MTCTRLIIGLIAVVVASACGKATDIRAQSEILGSWEWALPESGCKEVYTYKPDGTATIVSGPVVYEDQYTISVRPSAGDRFKLEAETKKQTSGVSCTGTEKDYVGNPYVVYVAFSSDKRSITVYGTPDGDAVMGPLYRVSK